MNRLYEIYSGEELKIAELIQRRRLQLLIHSCLYYNMDTNIVSDKKWDEWARELVKLQKDYPELSNNVCWSEAFADWDASSGAFLPLDDPWVIRIAKRFVQVKEVGRVVKQPEQPKKSKPKSTNGQFTLF